MGGDAARRRSRSSFPPVRRTTSRAGLPSGSAPMTMSARSTTRREATARCARDLRAPRPSSRAVPRARGHRRALRADQRQAPLQVARMKRRFLAAFGHPVDGLYAMPELHSSRRCHRRRSRRRSDTRRRPNGSPRSCAASPSSARTSCARRRTIDAKRALLAIPGVGAFPRRRSCCAGSAATTRTRCSRCSRAMRADLRRRVGCLAIARRYGDQIGYWTYYLKTGVARG